MMGMRVSLANPSLGTGMPSSGPVKLGMDGGSSPSGNTKPLPGSWDTTARTLGFFMATVQPSPPLRVTSKPGPILSNSTETASVATFASKRSRVRHHLPKVLVQRLRVARELHAGKERRPATQPEHVEPPLVIRRCADRGSDRAA